MPPVVLGRPFYVFAKEKEEEEEEKEKEEEEEVRLRVRGALQRDGNT